jgi:hypothetical protein
MDKFGGVKGCDTNALIKGDDCLPAVPVTTAVIEAKVDAWLVGVDARIELPCGNGLNDPGEKCDASAPSAGWAVCGPDFACVACNCACPTKVAFTGTATAPESTLDTGWTGISHRAPIISDGTVSVGIFCGGTSRPCGTCTVSGPIANGPGQLDNRRCTNDTSIHCTNNTPCTGGGGTCQFFFGSNLPLSAGGVTVCAVNQFNGSVSGTANVETGDTSTVANLTARVYTGIAIDNPCARCVGDATINDGVLGGTCDGGTRVGLTCDGNGTVANRPDFGTTSLDCPLAAGALIATLPIDLSNTTDTYTRTLSASSPACTGAPGERCLCDTCDNAAASPCYSNVDCAAVGATICGGKRCLGGTNAGEPCVAASECPGGGICGRPGEPTKPSACLDDTSTTPTTLDCLDGGNGEGTCTQGPVDTTCSVASGHAQRGCLGDGDCGGGGGSCVATNRKCFLTGGFTGTRLGTNTLTAVGMADAPMADTSNPTLASVFCVGPTGSSSVNAVSGLPGPGRTTIKGAALGQP